MGAKEDKQKLKQYERDNAKLRESLDALIDTVSTEGGMPRDVIEVTVKCKNPSSRVKVMELIETMLQKEVGCMVVSPDLEEERGLAEITEPSQVNYDVVVMKGTKRP